MRRAFPDPGQIKRSGKASSISTTTDSASRRCQRSKAGDRQARKFDRHSPPNTSELATPSRRGRPYLCTHPNLIRGRASHKPWPESRSVQMSPECCPPATRTRPRPGSTAVFLGVPSVSIFTTGESPSSSTNCRISPDSRLPFACRHQQGPPGRSRSQGHRTSLATVIKNGRRSILSWVENRPGHRMMHACSDSPRSFLASSCSPRASSILHRRPEG